MGDDPGPRACEIGVRSPESRSRSQRSGNWAKQSYITGPAKSAMRCRLNCKRIQRHGRGIPTRYKWLLIAVSDFAVVMAGKISPHAFHASQGHNSPHQFLQKATTRCILLAYSHANCILVCSWCATLVTVSAGIFLAVRASSNA